jgi:hypothetical protein
MLSTASSGPIVDLGSSAALMAWQAQPADLEMNSQPGQAVVDTRGATVLETERPACDTVQEHVTILSSGVERRTSNRASLKKDTCFFNL